MEDITWQTILVSENGFSDVEIFLLVIGTYKNKFYQHRTRLFTVDTIENQARVVYTINRKNYVSVEHMLNYAKDQVYRLFLENI